MRTREEDIKRGIEYPKGFASYWTIIAFEELRKTKHALWMARAKNANAMNTKEMYNEYKREHPYSIWNSLMAGYSYSTSFSNWSRTFIHVENLCREKAKEYE